MRSDDESGEVTAMRLIDVDALGVGRCSRDLLPADYCAGWNGLIRLLEKAPTVDAAPVVRCKECKHSYEVLSGWCCSYGVCVDCIVPEDFYCANGERRGGGDDAADGNV